MKALWRKVLRIAPFAAAAIMVLFAGWSILSSMRGNNYGALNAPTVFENVVGYAVPPGVSNLRVSGRSAFSKHWVWMRFDASEEALKTLTKGKETWEDELSRIRLSQNYSASKVHEWADKQAVGWKQLSSLPRKEVYPVGNYRDGISWNGYMVVDKQTHAVYIHAGD